MTITIESESADPTKDEINNYLVEKLGIKASDITLFYADEKWEASSLLDFAETGYEGVTNLMLQAQNESGQAISMSGYTFQSLTERHADLACEVSMNTRNTRYTLENHPSAGDYWNNLNRYDRIKLLMQPIYSPVLLKILDEKQRTQSVREPTQIPRRPH